MATGQARNGTPAAKGHVSPTKEPVKKKKRPSGKDAENKALQISPKKKREKPHRAEKEKEKKSDPSLLK